MNADDIETTEIENYFEERFEDEYGGRYSISLDVDLELNAFILSVSEFGSEEIPRLSGIINILEDEAGLETVEFDRADYRPEEGVYSVQVSDPDGV